MMLTCAKCGRTQPLTDDDVANFYPRFFCLSCGAKLPFDVPETKLRELFHSNDRARTLSDLAGLPAQDTVRRVHKTSEGEDTSGG
jgi:hypothetical protein